MTELRGAHRRRRRERGFTLPEALVASAIVAAMLGVTLGVVQTNARAARINEERRAALLVAQSQMAVAEVAVAGRFAQREGRSGTIGWTLRIEPFRSSLASPALDQITVTAGEGPSGQPLVSLTTLRVAGT
ncbi:MAG TPA: type II secretion system protein [Erythrobacter sp.]|nr:type II secretion system protein [Erythrobacter sp.]